MTSQSSFRKKISMKILRENVRNFAKCPVPKWPAPKCPWPRYIQKILKPCPIQSLRYFENKNIKMRIWKYKNHYEFSNIRNTILPTIFVQSPTRTILRHCFTISISGQRAAVATVFRLVMTFRLKIWLIKCSKCDSKLNKKFGPVSGRHRNVTVRTSRPFQNSIVSSQKFFLN